MRSSRGAVKLASQQSSTVDVAAAAVVSVTVLLSASPVFLDCAAVSVNVALLFSDTAQLFTEIKVESRCLIDRPQLLNLCQVELNVCF